MFKETIPIYNVGDTVSTTVFHKTGTIDSKVFDICRNEFVYSIKAGALTLCNVSYREILKKELQND